MLAKNQLEIVEEPGEDCESATETESAVWWEDRLACPVCKARLRPAGGAERLLRCDGADAHSFPRAGNTPILINDANSVFTVADFIKMESVDERSIVHGMYGSDEPILKQPSLREAYRNFATHLAEFRVKLDRPDIDDALRTALEKNKPAKGERLKVLILGAGAIRYEETEHARHFDFVYSDVTADIGADIVCDAHDIPFNDESLDFVICDAVLSNVADPHRVVAEIHRVLKPEGWTYASTPFMQPVCMGVYDVTRFTMVGYRRLFRWFHAETLEPCSGPASALAYVWQYFLMSFSANPTAVKILKLIGLLTTRPLKFLDKFLMKKPMAADVAGAFVIIAQKADEPISDRMIFDHFQKKRII
ncbi:MAG: class I SAM-dependent methyltransferase [Geminicoccaceae bacterium]